MDTAWIQELIRVLEKALKDDGKIKFLIPPKEEILVEIKEEFVKLIKVNQQRLAQISKEAFQRFLELKRDGKDFEALVAIYDALETTELVEKFKEDSIKLAELARQIQETRKFWLKFSEQLGTRLAMGLLSLVIA
jgi:tRNA1(Val) A37 N6-methylase TrmN6